MQCLIFCRLVWIYRIAHYTIIETFSGIHLKTGIIVSVILGLNFHHAGAAACLLVDGRLVGAVAEERLGDHLKHNPAFPENAIRWLLTNNGLKKPRNTTFEMPARS